MWLFADTTSANEKSFADVGVPIEKNTLRGEVYYIGVPIGKKNTLREEVYYIGVPIEKIHIKGGGLLYWCSNIKKNTLREKVYYIGVPIEKKHVKGGGLL